MAIGSSLSKTAVAIFVVLLAVAIKRTWDKSKG